MIFNTELLKESGPCHFLKRRKENLGWSIINYDYYTALLQNTNIYTVYADSRAAGAQSFQLKNSNSEGSVSLSIKHQTRGDPPTAVHVTLVYAFILIKV